MITLTASRLPARSVVRVLLAASGLAVAGLGLGGCNSSNTALMEANRALQDRNTALTAENESLSNLVQQLQGAVSSRDKALSDAQSLITALQSGKSGLEGQLAGMQDRLNNLNFGNLNVSALDPATDQALKELAARHSDLLEYDSQRGLIRFKSDVTFDSGSDVVRADAKPTLRALADILNTSAAGYDIRVIGHTDAQRLSARTAQRHSTNIRLSADRAISVRNELVSGGVSAPRFEIGGRGEFDPMVPNTRSGNTPQNRRVEIFLVQSRDKIAVTPAGDPIGAAPAPAPAPARSAPAEDIMK